MGLLSRPLTFAVIVARWRPFALAASIALVAAVAAGADPRLEVVDGSPLRLAPILLCLTATVLASFVTGAAVWLERASPHPERAVALRLACGVLLVLALAVILELVLEGKDGAIRTYGVWPSVRGVLALAALSVGGAAVVGEPAAVFATSALTMLTGLLGAPDVGGRWWSPLTWASGSLVATAATAGLCTLATGLCLHGARRAPARRGSSRPRRRQPRS